MPVGCVQVWGDPDFLLQVLQYAVCLLAGVLPAVLVTGPFISLTEHNCSYGWTVNNIHSLSSVFKTKKTDNTGHFTQVVPTLSLLLLWMHCRIRVVSYFNGNSSSKGYLTYQHMVPPCTSCYTIKHLPPCECHDAVLIGVTYMFVSANLSGISLRCPCCEFSNKEWADHNPADFLRPCCLNSQNELTYKILNNNK